MTTLTRRIGALVALLAVAMSLSVPVGAPPAHAATNAIDFGGGRTRVTAGPNHVVTIDGSLNYDDECTSGGTKDFFYYPETGVYHYSWKTERSWQGTCREVVVRLTDGTERRAWFLFN